MKLSLSQQTSSTFWEAQILDKTLNTHHTILNTLQVPWSSPGISSLGQTIACVDSEVLVPIIQPIT